MYMMRFTTFVAFSALFTSAFSAPTANRRPTRRNVSAVMWENVKKNSTRLNEIAKNLTASRPTVHVDRNVNIKLELVETKDKCDPDSLRNNSGPCLEKIGAALKNYSLIFKMIGQCNNEVLAKTATSVSAALGDLMHQLGVSQPDLKWNVEEERWKGEELYNFTINRLLSFSILTARVFALGNPALHNGTGTGGCI